MILKYFNLTLEIIEKLKKKNYNQLEIVPTTDIRLLDYFYYLFFLSLARFK